MMTKFYLVKSFWGDPKFLGRSLCIYDISFVQLAYRLFKLIQALLVHILHTNKPLQKGWMGLFYSNKILFKGLQLCQTIILTGMSTNYAYCNIMMVNTIV